MTWYYGVDGDEAYYCDDDEENNQYMRRDVRQLQWEASIRFSNDSSLMFFSFVGRGWRRISTGPHLYQG